MEKIASFTINHLTMKRGIFVSRKDKLPNGDIVTTFDIRMKEPNREPVVHQDALHTIEHLAATFLRNHPEWKHKVIYWGPMGCCTGNYSSESSSIPRIAMISCNSLFLWSICFTLYAVS